MKYNRVKQQEKRLQKENKFIKMKFVQKEENFLKILKKRWNFLFLEKE